MGTGGDSSELSILVVTSGSGKFLLSLFFLLLPENQSQHEETFNSLKSMDGRDMDYTELLWPRSPLQTLNIGR